MEVVRQPSEHDMVTIRMGVSGRATPSDPLVKFDMGFTPTGLDLMVKSLDYNKG